VTHDCDCDCDTHPRIMESPKFPRTKGQVRTQRPCLNPSLSAVQLLPRQHVAQRRQSARICRILRDLI